LFTLFSVTLLQGTLVMKYDAEYISYKFSTEELSIIVHSLISYSSDPFLDKITQKNVIGLLEGINKSTKIPVIQ
jgi:hypothetical protein